jgi:DNA-binding response OmpR family regulator
MDDRRRVLVVEDERTIAEPVAARLRAEGFAVDVVHDGPTAVQTARSTRPDLIILDIMLPGFDGLEVCRRIQAERPVPVIMLTARDDEMSVVVGLEVGADDYITKPFSHRELVSRVRATLRRRRIDARASSKQESLEFPGLVLDPARRQVVAQGSPADLTTAQFDILLLLASHPGRVYGRGQIMATVWGSEFSGDSRAADMQIRNIREKIEPEPKNPRYVLTVRGMGYKFAEI